jgi:hypothetical protein
VEGLEEAEEAEEDLFSACCRQEDQSVIELGGLEETVDLIESLVEMEFTSMNR